MTISKKDFQNDNEVRWCPGCGDYAILATVQKTLAELAINRDEIVIVSGIGCAARFPYYMNTYGMHTIHGRAPAFASGIKLANKRLHVILITGDGDGLSIGANHLLHLFRRNIDITVLLFNNQIYGLTKGQYSPTSAQGHKAKSTPFGSLEHPINPIAFALAAGASFVARSIDNDAVHLGQILKDAIAHAGTSFIEIMQNCIVFNDGVFDYLREKNKREENILFLTRNEPLLFYNGKKGIILEHSSLKPKVVDAQNNFDILLHEPDKDGLKAFILASLTQPDFPTPIGVFRRVARATYEELLDKQDEEIKKISNNIDLKTLLRGENNWEI
jgi:2-oxoglutarate/2-oxoacid ferredoxin oxidoreductase subunit beta